MGGPRRSRPLLRRKLVWADQVIEVATLLSTFDTLPPTLPMAVMAATEISEAISTYSMAVAPSSFFISLRKMDNMGISKIMTAGAAFWELAAFRHTTLAVIGVIPMYQ